MGCLFSDPYDEDAAAVARGMANGRRIAPASHSAVPRPSPVVRSVASLPPTAVLPSPTRPPEAEPGAGIVGGSSLPKRELSRPQDHVLTDSQAKPGRDSRDGAVERRASIPKPGVVTKAELAEHGKSSPEPWTAIKGVVYDLSAFLSKCVAVWLHAFRHGACCVRCSTCCTAVPSRHSDACCWPGRLGTLIAATMHDS